MKQIIKIKDFDLCYRKQMAEMYLVSREGDIIYLGIDFCPFWEKKYSQQIRTLLQNIRSELGIDTNAENFDESKLDDILPSESHTDEWWKKRGL